MYCQRKGDCIILSNSEEHSYPFPLCRQFTNQIFMCTDSVSFFTLTRSRFTQSVSIMVSQRILLLMKNIAAVIPLEFSSFQTRQQSLNIIKKDKFTLPALQYLTVIIPAECPAARYRASEIITAAYHACVKSNSNSPIIPQMRLIFRSLRILSPHPSDGAPVLPVPVLQ